MDRGTQITEQSDPLDLMVVERQEWGNFYGRLLEVKEDIKRSLPERRLWRCQTKIAEP